MARADDDAGCAYGAEGPHSTVLIADEEAAAVFFRQQSCLPLDDCLYALQDTLAHVSRSALHRLFQRHGISQLPVEAQPAKAEKKKFKD